jgi:hypothetical protein
LKPSRDGPNALRVVRVLERAGNADARGLLIKFAAGEYGADYIDEAKATLAGLRVRSPAGSRSGNDRKTSASGHGVQIGRTRVVIDLADPEGRGPRRARSMVLTAR